MKKRANNHVYGYRLRRFVWQLSEKCRVGDTGEAPEGRILGIVLRLCTCVYIRRQDEDRLFRSCGLALGRLLRQCRPFDCQPQKCPLKEQNILGCSAPLARQRCYYSRERSVLLTAGLPNLRGVGFDKPFVSCKLSCRRLSFGRAPSRVMIGKGLCHMQVREFYVYSCPRKCRRFSTRLLGRSRPSLACGMQREALCGAARWRKERGICCCGWLYSQWLFMERACRYIPADCRRPRR